jgi:drug/metabolite transporter (DMT)-like permease
MFMSSPIRWAQLLLFIAPLLWTVNYLVARWAPGEVAPHLLALGRWSFALVIMAVAMGQERTQLWQAFKNDWKTCLLMGGLGMWICGAFVYIGGQSTQAINIALIYSASPIGVALISHWFLNEKLSAAQALGIFIALFGVLAIIAKGQLLNLLQLQFNSGDWWIVTAAIAWSIYSILMRHRPSPLSGNLRLAVITLGGIMVLLPFALIEWFAYGWMPGALAGGLFSWKALGLILLAAVFPGFIAYRAFSFIVAHLGTAPASIMLYLGPLYAAVAAWLVLDESLQWFHALGALFILPGVYLASRVPLAKTNKCLIKS